MWWHSSSDVKSAEVTDLGSVNPDDHGVVNPRTTTNYEIHAHSNDCTANDAVNVIVAGKDAWADLIGDPDNIVSPNEWTMEILPSSASNKIMVSALMLNVALGCVPPFVAGTGVTIPNSGLECDPFWDIQKIDINGNFHSFSYTPFYSNFVLQPTALPQSWPLAGTWKFIRRIGYRQGGHVYFKAKIGC